MMSLELVDIILGDITGIRLRRKDQSQKIFMCWYVCYFVRVPVFFFSPYFFFFLTLPLLLFSVSLPFISSFPNTIRILLFSFYTKAKTLDSKFSMM